MPSHCLLDFVVAILCILLRTQSGACIQGSEPYIHKIVLLLMLAFCCKPNPNRQLFRVHTAMGRCCSLANRSGSNSLRFSTDE